MSPHLDDLRTTIETFRHTAQDAASLPVVVRVNGSIAITPPAGDRAPLTGTVATVQTTSHACRP